ncbi:PIN domain-containing protein [Propionibacterium ruminifibrarum]|uniref:PIN domain-containing protein n=1 Tax=Propionibacterium ruminifibrarum TaxID=1962131 RepID=UPI001EF13BCE|nr:PIN domain-containing protein [Propionibacterium ruminifibrarum]
MTLGGTSIFPDANFWMSRTLRDWLIQIYLVPEHAPFMVYWTEDVYAETAYHLRRKHPEWDGKNVAKFREKFEVVFPAGRLDDFDGRPDNVVLADENDQHIHAAAVACRADYVVTSDKGFHAVNRDELPYEVYTPDEFFTLVDESMPSVVRAAALLQFRYWEGNTDEPDIAAHLRKAGCPEFASRVGRHLYLALSGSSHGHAPI